MNDSYAWYLECLFDNLLKDVVEQYPDYRRGASRDLDRLRTAIKARGTQSITIDLPNLSKELDKALSTGCLGPSSLPLSRSKKKGCPIPRLFWGMYIRIFNRDGCLLDHPDSQAILILRTLLNVGKKLKMDCGNSKTVKAVREFYQVDYSVISPTLEWDSDDFSPLDAQRLSLDDLSSERGPPSLNLEVSMRLIAVVVLAIALMVFSLSLISLVLNLASSSPRNNPTSMGLVQLPTNEGKGTSSSSQPGPQSWTEPSQSQMWDSPII